jgi:hypothetical protein
MERVIELDYDDKNCSAAHSIAGMLAPHWFGVFAKLKQVLPQFK